MRPSALPRPSSDLPARPGTLRASSDRLRKLLLPALLLPMFLAAQVRHTVSGSVKAAATGEDLIGATVIIAGTTTGTTTNLYGFYSLALEPGTHTLQFRFIGYTTVERTITVSGDLRLDVALPAGSAELEEVEVTGTRSDGHVADVQMSSIRMGVEQMRTIPALFGEVDVIKSLQLLPGVATNGEGGSGMYVRGGGVDQNLILLDEAPVYNASHLMGFFSVFNPDAIKDVQLYTGGIPAQYGGRLSSVVDIRMKDGNNKRFAMEGGVGTIASRLTVEAPIVKNKGSFILSGRRTYADLFLGLAKNEDLHSSRLFFYDLNLKANYAVTAKDRVFLSGYFGRDVFRNGGFGVDWGNATGTVRWNHLHNSRLFSNVTLYYSNFNYALGTDEQTQAFSWKSNIRDLGAKLDLNYYLDPSNTLSFGYQLIRHQFNPGMVRSEGEGSVVAGLELERAHALEHAAYVSNEQRIGTRFTATYGLRVSMFQNVGSKTIYTYDEDHQVNDTLHYGRGEVYNTSINLEPRIGLRYGVNELSSVKASYNRTAQYLHLASNGLSSSPFDVWFPSSPNVKPQLADQVALGYFRNIHGDRWELSVETYYKVMHNAIDFRDNAQLFLNDNLEAELRFGTAWSYGLEVLLRKQTGRFTGMVGYTLARTERRIDGVNNGERYRANWDRTHDLALVGSFEISPLWRIGANWVYQTGGAVTLPVGRFEYGGTVVPVYSARNAGRMPAYHRADLSVTKASRRNEGRRWQSEWVFSVYNLYGRKNAYAINFVQDPDAPHVTYAEKTYLFSIVPAITYNFKF